jgi:hypothetical protein
MHVVGFSRKKHATNVWFCASSPFLKKVKEVLGVQCQKKGLRITCVVGFFRKKHIRRAMVLRFFPSLKPTEVNTQCVVSKNAVHRTHVSLVFVQTMLLLLYGSSLLLFPTKYEEFTKNIYYAKRVTRTADVCFLEYSKTSRTRMMGEEGTCLCRPKKVRENAM